MPLLNGRTAACKAWLGPLTSCPRERSRRPAVSSLLLAGACLLGAAACTTAPPREPGAEQAPVEPVHAPAPAPSESPTEPPRPSAESSWLIIDRPPMKLLPPDGWSKDAGEGWSVFTSPGGEAMFGVTDVHRPGESTAKLGAVARLMGLNEVAWTAVSEPRVGQGSFPARMGEGDCDFRGPGGHVAYMIVDLGGPDQVMLIYAISANGTAAHKDAALQAISSLKRR